MSYTIFIYEIFFNFYAYISFFFVYLQHICNATYLVIRCDLLLLIATYSY